MAQPYPIPRSTRQSGVLSGDGGATYGPFGFKVFDAVDVRAYVQHAGEGGFEPAAFSVAKVAGQPFDDFTLTFAEPVAEDDRFIVASARLHERLTAITRGGTISAVELEKELSKQGSVIEELRRDVDRSIRSDYGQDPQVLPPRDPGKLLGWGETKLENKTIAGNSGEPLPAEPLAYIKRAANNAQYEPMSSDEVRRDIDALVVTPSVSGLKALDASAETMAAVTGDLWRFEEGDYSSRVALDANNRLYAAPNDEPTGAFGAWVRRQLGAQELEVFDAVGDSSTDCLNAVNEAIEAINTGLINGVKLRAFGRYALSADPDPITARVWSWIGDGTPVFVAQDASSTAQTFFTIGSDSFRTNVFELGGFRVANNRNADNLDPGKAAIFLKHAGLGYVYDITAGNVAGVLECGEKDGSTTVIQSRVVNVTGDCRADLGGKGIRINRASNTSFTNTSVSLPAGVSASVDFRALLLKPANEQPIDSIKFLYGENNFPADRPVPTIFEIDTTGGNVVNSRWTEVVFDYARERSLYLHCDSGGVGHFLNNYFDKVRFFCAGRPTGTETQASVWIENLSNTDFHRNVLNGCYLYGRYGRALRYNRSSIGNNDSLSVKDCIVLDRMRTETKLAAIEIGVRDVEIDGLVLESFESGQPTGYAHAVRFLNNVRRYTVRDSDFTWIASNDAISPENLSAGIVGERLVTGNKGPCGPTFRLSGVTGSAVIAWRTMLSRTAVMLEARIVGNRVNGSARAAFVIRAAFHKNTGAVVQLGSTNASLSEPGSDSVTAAFSISGDDINVVVGSGAIPYNWGCDVEVTQVPWAV